MDHHQIPFIYFLLVGILISNVESNFFHRHKCLGRPKGDVGSPLLLTPYLESGRSEEGKNLARVCPTASLVESYTGFFTTDKTYNSNMFFWYFPAEEDAKGDAPVVVWLNGGPGASSTMGLFTENGPLYLDLNNTLKLRTSGRWSKKYHLVYFDNPVGTGFSWTEKDAGYATNEENVGEGLRSAFLQFLDLFGLGSRKVFLTGESYAGKYVPAMADALRGSGINLSGIAIGNGYSAPDLMLSYGDYLYQIGLLDANGLKLFKEKEMEITKDILSQDWTKAFEDLWGFVVGGGLFQNLTSYTYHYNIMHNSDDSQFGDTDSWLQSEEIRKCIHVGNAIFHTGEKVQQYLAQDFPQSVKPTIEKLLEETQVLIYSGQLDIIVAYPLTENFLRHLEWSGSEDYLKAERKPWLVEGKLAGYSKKAGRLTEVLVRNAGHMVPMDQPLWALDMINRFINGESF